MATAVQNRKRLEYKIDRLEKGAEAALASQRRATDTIRADVTLLVEILAGLQHIEQLQRELYALDRQCERLACAREYYAAPWWKRPFALNPKKWSLQP
jgi:hypothetical protein